MTKQEAKQTIIALKKRLKRAEAKAKGLAVAVRYSKNSRDQYAQRYWEFRRSSTGTGPVTIPGRYQASYEMAKAHLMRHIKYFQDGGKLFFYQDPTCEKTRPIDHTLVEWKIIKLDESNFELDFVREFRLVE